jgi:uncharacterized protein (DUF1778 family)
MASREPSIVISCGPAGSREHVSWIQGLTMPRTRSALRGTKVQLRMRPLQKDVIARAARLKQTTVTNFIVEHAFDAAQQVLADQAHFYLSPKKWDEFCAALDAPPKPSPALRRLLTEPGVFDGTE